MMTPEKRASEFFEPKTFNWHKLVQAFKVAIEQERTDWHKAIDQVKAEKDAQDLVDYVAVQDSPGG